MQAKAEGVTWIRVKILDFFLIRFIGGNFSGKLKILLQDSFVFLEFFPIQVLFEKKSGKASAKCRSV